MTQREKLLQQFLDRPTSLKFYQIKNILMNLDFVEISTRESHHKFKHPILTNDLIIPVRNNDCKDFYKKLALKIVKQNNIINSIS